MGLAAYSSRTEARRVFAMADEALGFALSKLCFEGPEEDLKLTKNTQPAILATSLALTEVVLSSGLRPDFVAGHSLGEYSALVTAGGLDARDALLLVRKRGQYMQEAVPVGEGAMAAVLGLPAEAVASICEDVSSERIVEPANMNGAGQVVIAGHRDAVERACELSKERGAKRAMMLVVSAPFHCRLMAPAARALEKDLAETSFSELKVPLFTNVDAEPITTASAARDALARQVASPVRWEQTIERMAEAGVSRFVEIGPGKVLSGLVRKIVKDASVHPVATPEDAEKLLSEVHVA